LPNNTLYDRGILFGSPHKKKSEVLFTFLGKHSFHPECILFIDDKLHHVEDLARACEEKGIEYYGIRFSAADDHVKSFDADLAEIQWRAFPTILTDEEAEIVQKNS